MDLSMVQARTRTDGFTTAIAPQHPSILVVAALQAWWVSLCIWPLDNVNPAHAMQVRERFATNGYVIFYGAVHEDTINSWRTIALTRGGYTEFTRAPLPSIHRKEASLIGQEVWLTGTCDPLCKNETTPMEDRRSDWKSSVAPEASRPDEAHVA
jgi:hypothetical protein